MRPTDFTEKRRTKRLDLTLPARLGISSKEDEKVREGVTLNVSFNGAYIININLDAIKENDSINVSLSVPRDEAREFPFSRIAGKAKVTRVEKDAVAIDFDEDVTRLFVAN